MTVQPFQQITDKTGQTYTVGDSIPDAGPIHAIVLQDVTMIQDPPEWWIKLRLAANSLPVIGKHIQWSPPVTGEPATVYTVTYEQPDRDWPGAIVIPVADVTATTPLPA